MFKPSVFLLFTLVGSDGKIYKCTDNRGKEFMTLGKIEKPGDFEKFWHSEERVKMQWCLRCPNQGCGRYAINVKLDAACNTFKNFGVDMSNDLRKSGGEDIIFI